MVSTRTNAGERFGIIEGVHPSEGPFTIPLVDGVAVRGVVRDLPERLRRHRIDIHLRRGPLVFDETVRKDGTFNFPRLPPGHYVLDVVVERMKGRIETPPTIEAGKDGEGVVILRYVCD